MALLINDYSTTNPANGNVSMISQELQADGVLVDGVGMQMHTNIQSPTPQVVETTIRKFAELGQVHITEFDMSIYTNNTDSYEEVSRRCLSAKGSAIASFLIYLNATVI
ncbi:MAG: endo-1,4-beta-xylanase [Caldilineaceae bacterium]